MACSRSDTVTVTWWGLISAHRGYHRVNIKEQDYRTVLGLKITVGSKRGDHQNKTKNTQLTKLVMVLINPPDACSSIAACFLNKQIQTVQNCALITTLYFIKALVNDLYLL